jgi:hypothetical protein
MHALCRVHDIWRVNLPLAPEYWLIGAGRAPKPMKMRSAFNSGLFFAVGVAASRMVLNAGTVPLAASTCSTSGCHGGAGDLSGQYAIWSQLDAHAHSYATLTTARAARMAEALSISDPTNSPRCIVCHAPMAEVGPSGLGSGVSPEEGVSCVSCHNAPDGWLRGHTRTDWTHADRVAAGMRDLDDLYTRANTCVGCHQNIDPELVGIGRHPALIFELDGQTQDEPRHWREQASDRAAQAWFVGQAVALREVSWALLNGRADAARSGPPWQGLVWLLNRSGLDYGLPPLGEAAPAPATLATAVEAADLLAKRAAQTWDPRYAGAVLRRLAATRNDFLASGAPPLVQACRAERLVLSLDRLLDALPAAQRPPGSSERLDRLFHLAQSQPDFVPAEFARELDGFAASLGEKG